RVVRVPAFDVHASSALRVVEVTTSLQQGGAERMAIDLTLGLRARGVATLLAVLGRPTRKTFEAPEETLDVSSLGRAARIDAIAGAAIVHGADVIHAHLLDGDETRRLAASGIPLVVTVHNARAGWPDGLAGVRDAELLVACSRAAERDLADARLPVAARTVWN